MSETLTKKLDEIFKDEIKFSRGVISDDYYAEQFHYFFQRLQYLYFNNLHIGKYNKLFTTVDIYKNSTAGYYVQILEKLRKEREENYKKESSIECFLISNLHFFNKIIEHNRHSQQDEVHLKDKFDVEQYKQDDSSYFKPIRKLFKLANTIQDTSKYIENIVLTNSLVSMDLVRGYSDVDALIFLKDAAFESTTSLKRVKNIISRLLKQVYLFDPLQHHCFYILNEVDLSFYPQSLYPTILFKNSVNLIEKDTKLIYHYRSDRIEKRLALYKTLRLLIDYTEKNDEDFSNLAILKHFTSNITLFPVFYIQLINGYIYKRDAFEQLDKYFSDISIFKKAEEIRNNFPYKRLIKHFPGFLHPSIISLIHCKLYKHSISESVKELKPLTRAFLESFIDKLYHEGI